MLISEEVWGLITLPKKNMDTIGRSFCIIVVFFWNLKKLVCLFGRLVTFIYLKIVLASFWTYL